MRSFTDSGPVPFFFSITLKTWSQSLFLHRVPRVPLNVPHLSHFLTPRKVGLPRSPRNFGDCKLLSSAAVTVTSDFAGVRIDAISLRVHQSKMVKNMTSDPIENGWVMIHNNWPMQFSQTLFLFPFQMLGFYIYFIFYSTRPEDSWLHARQVPTVNLKLE